MRCAVKVFGMIQYNHEMTFLLAPEWVPKDANLTATLLLYQTIRAFQSGKKVPSTAKMQARCFPRGRVILYVLLSFIQLFNGDLRFLSAPTPPTTPRPWGSG